MSPSAPMSLDALNPLGKTLPTVGTPRADGKDFAAMIESSQAPAKDEAREAADQLVATAFILPLLEQARNDPFKSDMFHGGRGEDIFGQQLDVIFADGITKSAHFGISDALVRQFQNPTSEQPQAQVNLLG